MPTLPTTRSGRFVFRATRYLKLRRRQANIYNVRTWDGEAWVWVGRYKTPNVGPLMLPAGLVRRPAGPIIIPPFNPYNVYVTAEGYKKPPHAKLATFPFHPPLSSVVPYGWRAPLAGYHRKRIRTCRRHKKAMTGWQRRVWGANVFYHKEGFFPDADPLNRLPNESNPPATLADYYPQGPWPTISPRDV